MSAIDPKSFFYSPICSWETTPHQIYFNSDLLSQGQYFKVLIITPDDNEQFLLRIISEGETEYKMFKVSPLGSFMAGSYLHGFTLDTSEAIKPGAYSVQVYSFGTGDHRERVIKEHWFHVLNAEEYREHWRGLFGETWDAPIFWDSLESQQTEELLEGLPLDKLFDIFTEEIRLDANTLYDLIGPITTALIANEIGGDLPCYVQHRSTARPSRIPHIDLTKLLWLLNALAPVLADRVFFSYGVFIETEASEERFSLLMTTEGRRDIRSLRDERSLDTQFPLVNLIGQVTEGIKFDITEDEFRLIVEADRLYEADI